MISHMERLTPWSTGRGMTRDPGHSNGCDLAIFFDGRVQDDQMCDICQTEHQNDTLIQSASKCIEVLCGRSCP